MNVTQTGLDFIKGFSWKSASIGFVLALAVGVFFGLHSRGTIDKLRSELTNADLSLVDAQNANRQLTSSNSRLQSELTTAGSQLADAQRIVSEQQRELDGQHGIIDEQKRRLGAIAESITSGGSDLESRARNIADLFDRLFEVYHGGAAASGASAN